MPIILERLKRETRPAHDAIEANPRLARVTAPDVRLDEYQDVLQRLWGFHQPIEAQVRQVLAPIDPKLALERRTRKTELLARDLAYFGCAPDSGARCGWFLPGDAATAWGVLYVLEGSTLGGRVILKHLERSLHLTPEHGGAYYAGYGPSTAVMWEAFRSQLTALMEVQPHWEDRVVAAAHATFLALDRWMAQP